ncbi:MAG: hypothetical protein WCL11_22195, partial [Verrucomicrobiota bacterium]
RGGAEELPPIEMVFHNVEMSSDEMQRALRLRIPEAGDRVKQFIRRSRRIRWLFARKSCSLGQGV